MSWSAVKLVVQRGPYLDLDHFEFRVLLSLAERKNTTTGQCNPSPERLAMDCGMSPTSKRHVRRVLRQLEAKGLIERVGSKRGGREENGRYATQQYRLLLDAKGGGSAPLLWI